jgi:hypothetical protein
VDVKEDITEASAHLNPADLTAGNRASSNPRAP